MKDEKIKLKSILHNLKDGTIINLAGDLRIDEIFQYIPPENHLDWELKFEADKTSEEPVAEKHKDRRAHPRADARFKVVLISGRRIFRTFTKNISLGGILLETSPPRDFSHPNLQIIVQRPDCLLNIMIPVTLVDPEQRRLKFLSLEDAERGELGSWLQSHFDLSSEALKPNALG